MDRRLGREEGRPYKTWLPGGRVGLAGPGPAHTAGFCVQRRLPQDELGARHGLWVQAGKLKVRKRTPLGHGQLESSFPSLCAEARDSRRAWQGRAGPSGGQGVAPPLHSRAQMGERNGLGRFLVLGHFHDRISSSEPPGMLDGGVL